MFCAQVSRQAGEDIIGTAATHAVYILIEWPPPWPEDEFSRQESVLAPFVDHLHGLGRSIRVLAIYNHQFWQPNRHRILIFQRSTAEFCCFQRREFEVDSEAAIVSTLQAWLEGALAETPNAEHTDWQDLLLCTHGSVDRCCARWGKPLYHAAVKALAAQPNHRVRLWQASHFGGHRFAPTAIAFPDGRYYGRLNLDTLLALLTRTGPIKAFQNIYRGLGLLPYPLQAMERQLVLQNGWSWLDLPVHSQILQEAEHFCLGQLCYPLAAGTIACYQAQISWRPENALCLLGDCGNSAPEVIEQFRVEQLRCLGAK